MVSGMSRASRNGIVVKTGTVLEKLANAKTGAFDKTGTITNGQLAVGEIIPASDSNFSHDQLLQLVASAESESSHILARSLVDYAKKQAVSLSPVQDLQEVTGKGITATVDGYQMKIGKLSFVDPDGKQAILSSTAVYIEINGQYAGAVTFVDHIRPEARQTMNALRKMGVTNLMMLTGDQAAFAKEVAKQVGITEKSYNIRLCCTDIDKAKNIAQSSNITDRIIKIVRKK